MPDNKPQTLFLPRVLLLCKSRNGMLFAAERVAEREKFTLGQTWEEETQNLQENVVRDATLLHQLGGKLQILSSIDSLYALLTISRISIAYLM